MTNTSRLLTLPAELREMIFKQVLQLPQPIKPRCPYAALCKGGYYRHYGYPHCGNLGRCSHQDQPDQAHKMGDEDAITNPFLPQAPFWNVLLSCKQIHAEAAWMLTALNTIEIKNPDELECLRREHPFPIPSTLR